MNKERLLTLANFLDSIEGQPGFDLHSWKREDPECGTTACAIGYACTIPAFVNAGLSLSLHSEFPSEGYARNYEPTYEGLKDFQAVAAFFDISVTLAEYLFLASPYRDKLSRAGTPRDVAEAIRKAIEAPPYKEAKRIWKDADPAYHKRVFSILSSVSPDTSAEREAFQAAIIFLKGELPYDEEASS